MSEPLPDRAKTLLSFVLNSLAFLALAVAAGFFVARLAQLSGVAS